MPRALPRSSEPPATRAERFGTLARRRRRTSLALLIVLLVCAVLVLALPKLGGESFAGLPLLGDRASESPSNSPDEGPEKRAAEDTASGDVAAAQSPSADGAAQGAATDVGVPSQKVKAQPGEIPDVSGRDVVEAARKLSSAGYDVAAIQTVKSEVEAGTTLKTKPAAGTAAESRTPVFLVTSGGPSGQAGD